MNPRSHDSNVSLLSAGVLVPAPVAEAQNDPPPGKVRKAGANIVPGTTESSDVMVTNRLLDEFLGQSAKKKP